MSPVDLETFNFFFFIQNLVESPPSGSKLPLMTRRQWTDPLGSDDEDEPSDQKPNNEPLSPASSITVITQCVIAI